MGIRRMALWYVMVLALGLAILYGSGTGIISQWLMPIAIFLLVGWVFSIGFMIVRLLRGKWSGGRR
jgi:hypothetical protein